MMPKGCFCPEHHVETHMWNVPHIKPPKQKYEKQNYNVSSRLRDRRQKKAHFVYDAACDKTTFKTVC